MKDNLEMLDGILQILVKFNEKYTSTMDFDRFLEDLFSSYTKEEFEKFDYLRKLENDRFIQFHNKTKDGFQIYIEPEAVLFFKNGGYQKKYSDELAEKELNLKLKKMQLEELEKRLSTLEKTMEDRTKFWNSTVKRNRAHITFMWSIIIINFLGMLLNIILYFYVK